MIAVGLMSGTSLDGIDAALVRVVPRATTYDIELLAFATTAFDPQLERALRAVLPPATGSVAALAALHRRLGEAFGEAARTIAGAQRCDYVASHGQTVWHDGEQATTLQIGDAFAIRERANATVCYDFRSADCAAGGQGAPLVAHVDRLLLGSAREDRICLNLGGIANLTVLPKSGEPIVAFDTGPGNVLLDTFVRQRTAERLRFDPEGSLAAAGRADAELVDAMLADPYFAADPPKTTGRERFGPHFLQTYRERLDRLSLEDGLATLTELTVASIAGALAPFAPDRTIVSGGGARNRYLLRRLCERLGGGRVETSASMNLPEDAKEAIAFAVLGYETLRGRCANVASATGAAHPVPLGAIAPQRLPELLARLERECAY